MYVAYLVKLTSWYGSGGEGGGKDTNLLPRPNNCMQAMSASSCLHSSPHASRQWLSIHSSTLPLYTLALPSTFTSLMVSLSLQLFWAKVVHSIEIAIYHSFNYHSIPVTGINLEHPIIICREIMIMKLSLNAMSLCPRLDCLYARFELRNVGLVSYMQCFVYNNLIRPQCNEYLNVLILCHSGYSYGPMDIPMGKWILL